jgi:hypothetical protein
MTLIQQIEGQGKLLYATITVPLTSSEEVNNLNMWTQ